MYPHSVFCDFSSRINYYFVAQGTFSIFTLQCLLIIKVYLYMTYYHLLQIYNTCFNTT